MTKDIQNLIEFVERKTRRQITSAPDYAEPGYSSPDKGILLGNWNPVCGFSVTKEVQRRDIMAKFSRIAEKLGYELEWEDEWTTCGDCGKAVRTSADCYSWTSHYRILNECELVCLDCLKPGDYLPTIEDNPRSACPPGWNPEDHGYVKYNGDFETGLHPGQNDDPAKVMAAMLAKGMRKVVFKLAAVGQFDARWYAYYREKRVDRSDDEGGNYWEEVKTGEVA